MAECFCGCGRTVRFATKRASNFGAQTDALLEWLRQYGQGDNAEALIREGEGYREWWLVTAHGRTAFAITAAGAYDHIPRYHEGAPPGSIGYSQAFHAWEDRVRAMQDVATVTGDAAKLTGDGETGMGRIAQIQLECPHCGKTTEAYIDASQAARADVKCQHCEGVFEFGPGMRYNPVGYVPAVPPGAELAEVKDETSDS